MKNNPIIPYILIMAFGIGLIFFMSMEGAGNKEEIAHGGEETTHGDTADAEAGGAELVASCIGCHGGDLTGGMGPSLVGLTDVEHIKNVIINGQGAMPAQGKSDAEAQAIADYITSLQ